MKNSISRKVFLGVNAAFLFVLMVIMLYPMIYVMFASFSNSSELMRHMGLLVRPLGFNLESYMLVFKNKLILSGYQNTLFIVVGGTCISLFLSILGAYFFCHDTMFKKPLMLLVMFTMYFGGGMIPSYLLVKGLGLIDNRMSLIIPCAIGTYNMILLRKGFEDIPKSLEESAMIDGAGHLRIIFQVIVPLAKSIISVIVLYYAVGYWNAWFNASIYIRSESKQPLQLILRTILIDNDTSAMDGSSDLANKMQVSETIKYAVIVVSTVPILCVYPFVQKYFVSGVMSGAVKG